MSDASNESGSEAGEDANEISDLEGEIVDHDSDPDLTDPASKAAALLIERLEDLIFENRVEEVREILRDNPTMDINYRDDTYPLYATTPLGKAVCSSEILVMVLAHPDIDVNKRGSYGQSPPFLWSLARHECARMMLQDARVDINQPDLSGSTPFCGMVHGVGFVESLKWCIASGRELDLGEPGNEKTDAIGRAENLKKLEAASLLKRFKANPAKTRAAVKKELRIKDFPVTTPPKLDWDQYVKFLDSLPLHPSAMFHAASAGHAANVTRFLLNPATDIFWRDSSKCTPLHRACGNGHDSVVAILLAHPSVDVNARSNNDITPFWGFVPMDAPRVLAFCSKIPGRI